MHVNTLKHTQIHEHKHWLYTVHAFKNVGIITLWFICCSGFQKYTLSTPTEHTASFHFTAARKNSADLSVVENVFGGCRAGPCNDRARPRLGLVTPCCEWVCLPSRLVVGM